MKEKYVPLYRKYRPQVLEEIVGQSHIKTALANAVELGKISHAYLFTGPRGTGKTSAARIFAKSLNCVKGPTASPCNKCENCLNITNSIPIDVIEIDAASNRKVEDAQNILERVAYAPVNSKYKIYIIDEVHMLSTTAFNALLKTLEEPPENVIFILATTEVHKVLDTIKSRCQRFDFKRITTADIVEHLKNIAAKEKINITDDALLAIAKNSAGGMRDSIALLDQLSILGGKDAITVDDINNLLGRLSFEVLNSLAGKIVDSTPQDALEILENIYNSGNEPVQILSNLMDYFKNLLIAKTCSDEITAELTQLTAEQNHALKTQSEKLEVHQIIFLVEKSSEYIKELKTTNNPRLWLEVAMIDLANLAQNTSLLALQERIRRLEGGAPVQSTPEPVKKIKEPSAENFAPMPKSAPTDDLTQLWSKILENIQSPPTRALLKQWGTPLAISPENVIITMKNEGLLNQFSEGNKKETLVNAVNMLFNQKDSKVLVRLEEDVPSNEPVPTPEPKPTEPEEIQEIPELPESEKQPVMHSDQVNMAVDLFDGKMI